MGGGGGHGHAHAATDSSFSKYLNHNDSHGHHATLVKDPAIERWGWQRENSFRYFSWTRKNIIIGAIVGVIVPAVLYGAVIRGAQYHADSNGIPRAKYWGDEIFGSPPRSTEH